MRCALPLLAMVVVGCAKPAPPATPDRPAAPAVVDANLTPEAMAQAMGVPIYPKAIAPDGMSKMPAKRTDGSTGYSLVLATPDPVPNVADWYAKALKLPALDGPVGKSVIGMTEKGTQIVLTVAPEAGRTVIRIKAIVGGR